MTVQPAVRKETANVAAGTAAGTALMLLVFWMLHRYFPGFVPFDYKVILSGILGFAVAAGNFFLMGITVQKVAAAGDDELAYKTMKTSYRYRTLGQLVWAVLAMALPFLNGAAGIIPLFFPSIFIKMGAILGSIKK